MSKAKTSFAQQLVAQLIARNTEQHSDDNLKAIKYIESSAVSINLTFDNPVFAELKKPLLKHIRIADAKLDRENFIGVKVTMKIAQVASALATNLINELDNHTKIIGFQLMKLSSITNKTAYVAQCKALEYDALDTVQELDRKHTANYTIGTTSTQTSSTRMMFKALGLCEVIKGKRNDSIVVLDNERTHAFIALFKGKTPEAELQAELDGVTDEAQA